MKRILIILTLIVICINTNSNVFCNDNHINNKLNKFIENEIECKYILAYLNHNLTNIENKAIKESMVDKVKDYNEKKLNLYQIDFDKMYKKNIKNIQTKQNLKSELNILNNMDTYESINIHKFNFIDNKPIIVKNLKEIYLSGYKIIVKNNKFKLKVNYDLLDENY